MSNEAVLSNTTAPVAQPDPINNGNHVGSPSLYRSLATYPFNTDSEYQAGLATILGHPDTPSTVDELNSKQDLVLQAQCFYFARKFKTPLIKSAEYKLWLASNSSSVQSSRTSTPKPTHDSPQPQSQPSLALSPLSSTAAPTPAPSIPSTTTQPEQPPYPISFAAIVDLITNDKPIPGIQEIPNTVLDPGSSKQDKATRRRKPWEKEEQETTATTTPDDSHITTTSTTTIPQSINTPPSQIQPQQHDVTGSETQIAKPRNTPNEGIVHILKPNAIPDSGLIAKE